MNYHERERYRFERAFESVGRPTGKTVLDIGSYPGTAIDVFARTNRYHSLGLTTSDSFLALLERFSIEHVQANIEDYAGQSDADVILFMEVIEHLRRPYAALQNLWRVAKRGALVYVTTNNASYFGYILKLLAHREILDSIVSEASPYPGHTRYYGLKELAHELEAIGFQVLSRSFVNLLPEARFYRQRAFGAVKNTLARMLPKLYASHIELLVRRP
jgi:2-polyprenyl-3-methyl-5-hydroxy-6-metoxy-1,4-benzoquinol methylase